MNVRKMLTENPEKALSEFGEEVVKEELDDMSYHGLADVALNAAHALDMREPAIVAARIVFKSVDYQGQDSKELAKKYLLIAKKDEDKKLKKKEQEFLLILISFKEHLTKFRTEIGRRSNTPILVVVWEDIDSHKTKKRYGRFKGFNKRSKKFTLGRAGSYGPYNIHVSEIRSLHQINREDAVDEYLASVNGP